MNKNFNNNLQLIKKILSENNLSLQFEKIQILNLNKYILYYYRKKFIYKIAKSQKSVNLLLNENIGYNYFKNKKIFLIPKKEIVLKKKNLLVLKIDFINGIKGNFFQIKNFYNINKQIQKKKINLKAYTEKLYLRYQTKKNFIFFRKILKSKNNNETKNIYISPSHGDFVHWNTIRNNNSYFTIDFEHFEKERVLFYDYFNWYFAPIAQKIYSLKIYFFESLLLSLLKFFFYSRFCSLTNIQHKEDFNIYLKLYLVEKKLMLEEILYFKKKFIISKDYMLRTKNMLRLVNKFILKC